MVVSRPFTAFLAPSWRTPLYTMNRKTQMAKTWQHLDADGKPLLNSRRYLLSKDFLGQESDLPGTIYWSPRNGYIFKPDNENLHIGSLPFQYQTGRILNYRHIRREPK